MHMSFFTKRERGFLSKCLAQGMSVPQAAADEQLTIEPVKAYIASNFPENEWDDWYRHVFMVHTALTTLADYNTCKRLEDWTWYVPRTPDRIQLIGQDEPVVIKTILHPESYDEHLRTIWDRPRQELMTIINILKASGKFTTVEMVSPDKRHIYWRLSWWGGHFYNRNVIYLHRR